MKKVPTVPRPVRRPRTSEDEVLWKHVIPLLFQVSEVAPALKKFEREMLPLLEAEPTLRQQMVTQYLPPAIRRQLPKRAQPRLATLLWYLEQVGKRADSPPAVLSIASQHMVLGFLSAVRLFQHESLW